VTGAEMAARRIAAAAVVADFRAELARHPLSRPPDGSWAFRLAEEVVSLLGQPDAGLSASQRAVLGQALAYAITFREPAGSCPDCDQHPARTTGATWTRPTPTWRWRASSESRWNGDRPD
jgi:hypothetical protein